MKSLKLLPRGKQKWRSFLLRWIIILVFLTSGVGYIISMPNSSYSGPFEPLSESENLLRDRLKKHVIMIADRIGERNIWHSNQLDATAEYIEEVLAGLGYEVSTQEFETKGVTVKNLEVQLIGTSQPKEIIVVGAHYDSVMGSPGANDNASGVSALLEIARLLAGDEPSRTVRLVAFVNEEPPFFQTGDMGSRVYASRSHQFASKL